MIHISLDTLSDYKVWVISDLHLGHGKDFILKPRGYTTVEQATKHIFDSLRASIGPNDVIINLGDAICGAGMETRELASQLVYLPCRAHYYIWGNHNAGMMDVYNEIRSEKGLLADNIEIYPARVPNSNFIFIGDIAKFTIDGRQVVL